MSAEFFLGNFFAKPWAMPRADLVALAQRWQQLRATQALSPRAERLGGSHVQFTADKKVAVVTVRGVIIKGAPDWTRDWGFYNPDWLHADLAEASAAAGVEKIVLHINSPGGVAIGIGEGAEALEALAARGIETVAYTDLQCCSAAYWWAAACGSIVAAPSAIVGSVGAILSIWDVSKLLEASGIGVDFFVSQGAEGKLIGHQERALTDEDRAYLQATVDNAGGEFADYVSRRRGLAREALTGHSWAAAVAPSGYVDLTRMGPRAVATLDMLLAALVRV